MRLRPCSGRPTPGTTAEPSGSNPLVPTAGTRCLPGVAARAACRREHDRGGESRQAGASRSPCVTVREMSESHGRLRQPSVFGQAGSPSATNAPSTYLPREGPWSSQWNPTPLPAWCGPTPARPHEACPTSTRHAPGGPQSSQIPLGKSRFLSRIASTNGHFPSSYEPLDPSTCRGPSGVLGCLRDEVLPAPFASPQSGGSAAGDGAHGSSEWRCCPRLWSAGRGWLATGRVRLHALVERARGVDCPRFFSGPTRWGVCRCRVSRRA